MSDDKGLWRLFSSIIIIAVVYIVGVIMTITLYVPDTDSRLQIIESTSIYTTWYDKETKVMYVSYNGRSGKNFTVMVNTDGTPLLYEEVENGD